MTVTNLPSGAETIAAAVAAASTGDVLMLAPLPSFVIVDSYIDEDVYTFKVQPGQGDRLRTGDVLYYYDPGNESSQWGLMTLGNIVGDTVTAASTLNGTPYTGMIAVVCYVENAAITVNKAIRFVARPYASENLTTSQRIESRLRGDPGPDPRVVVYGRFVCSVDGTSFSGMTIIGHDAAAAVIGSAGVSSRRWQIVDCMVRDAPEVVGAGGGLEYPTLVRRCKLFGSNTSRGAALIATGVLVEATVIAAWRCSVTACIDLFGVSVMRCCTIVNVVSSSASGVRGLIYTQNDNARIANTIISNTVNFVYTLRNTGWSTAETYGCVVPVSALITGFTNSDLTNTNQIYLDGHFALTERSPAATKITTWTGSAYMPVLDMNRYVLDANQPCVGAYAWSKYRAAAFAWMVSKVLVGLSVADDYQGAWLQPDEPHPWIFQTPDALLRWLEIGGQYTLAPTDADADACFDVHFGMNANGQIRMIVRGDTMTNAEVGTEKRTPARWILGIGDMNSSVSDQTFNFVPNYISCTVLFDKSDPGEWAATALEPFDMGGVGAMPTHPYGYRTTYVLTIVTEPDEVQPKHAPYLQAVTAQRLSDFFRKLSSGCPVRFYETKHCGGFSSLDYRGYDTIPQFILGSFDANVLDENQDVTLPWAETVMGRYSFQTGVCEMWGL